MKKLFIVWSCVALQWMNWLIMATKLTLYLLGLQAIHILLFEL